MTMIILFIDYINFEFFANHYFVLLNELLSYQLLIIDSLFMYFQKNVLLLSAFNYNISS